MPMYIYIYVVYLVSYSLTNNSVIITTISSSIIVIIIIITSSSSSSSSINIISIIIVNAHDSLMRGLSLLHAAINLGRWIKTCVGIGVRPCTDCVMCIYKVVHRCNVHDSYIYIYRERERCIYIYIYTHYICITLCVLLLSLALVY